MTDKELRRLSRPMLIELLITQMEENEKLERRLRELEKQISDRKIIVSRAGSIANAALTLNGVFESAESAASQYLDNIRRANDRCDLIIEKAQKKAEEIVGGAQKRSSEIVGSAQKRADEIVRKSEQDAERIRKEARGNTYLNNNTKEQQPAKAAQPPSAQEAEKKQVTPAPEPVKTAPPEVKPPVETVPKKPPETAKKAPEAPAKASEKPKKAEAPGSDPLLDALSAFRVNNIQGKGDRPHGRKY